MRNKRRDINIPVVAMSDIAFLLLIFLMVTSISSSQRSIRLTLPRIQGVSKVNIKKSVNLFVNRSGAFFYGNKPVTPEVLLDRLETDTALNKSTTVFIYGDEETEYRSIDRLITLLKEQGLRNCVFVTRKDKQ